LGLVLKEKKGEALDLSVSGGFSVLSEMQEGKEKGGDQVTRLDKAVPGLMAGISRGGERKKKRGGGRIHLGGKELPLHFF